MISKTTFLLLWTIVFESSSKLECEFKKIVDRNIEILSFGSVQKSLKCFSIEERIDSEVVTRKDLSQEI
jgi:hypothetical protein